MKLGGKKKHQHLRHTSEPFQQLDQDSVWAPKSADQDTLMANPLHIHYADIFNIELLLSNPESSSCMNTFLVL